MPSKWIEHIKAFAAKNNLSYGCALSDPECRATYTPVKKTTQKKERETMGGEDINRAGAPFKKPEPPKAEKPKAEKPKAKPKAKKEKAPPAKEIAQKILDDFWSRTYSGEDDEGNLVATPLVELTDEFIFFYNTPTSEAKMATLIADKITELNNKYNVNLTRPTFWSPDNIASNTSFQSWQPDWETVKYDMFWKTKYPPLKKTKAKKVK